MKTIHIDRIDSPELNVYTQLTEAQLRNRLEPEKGIFIAESLKVARIALEKGLEPVSFLAERKYVDEQIIPLFGDKYDIPVYTGERSLLSKLTGYELTRGFLCAMKRPTLPSVEEVCRNKSRIAVLDNVVNSTNTGAIFRAATALGIEGLLLSPTCCDPLNRRSVRVSMGTVFQMPWTYIENWDDIGAQRLRDLGFSSVALALSPDAVAIDDKTLMSLERIALVLGTEGDGLPEKTLEACDYVAMIPMQQGVDSLNVAAAAAVAFWQLRKR
ncbi:MAG: RNA methyltransferase [Bacteroidales bacterium]|nr:RNA methyltransferase [Bacteroidales bacterium]